MQGFRAGAEAAANVGLDDADMTFCHAHGTGQHLMHIERHLRGRADGQAFAGAVVLSKGRMRLHLYLANLGAMHIDLAHQISIRHFLIHIA